MIGWTSLAVGLGVLLYFGAASWPRRGAGLLLGAYVVALVLYHGMDGVSGGGVNAAVLYHIASGLEGVGLAGQAAYLAGWIAVLAAGLVGVWWLLTKVPPARRRLPQWVALLALGGAVYATPLSSQLRQQLPLIQTLFFSGESRRVGDVDLGQLGYQLPAQAGVANADRNIVWIYMESLEKAYFQQQHFGNLLPQLTALSREAIRFTSVGEAPYTGWTMGGIVGSQCGVPLTMFGRSDINELTGFGEFLPGATCVGDLLRQQGYATEFLGGASLAFAGKGDFFRTHGFSSILGREELSALVSEQIPTNVWGYHDDTLFDVARDRFDKLYSKQQPFLLSLLTLDTHAPDGFHSPRCEREGLFRGDDSVLDAVRCSDFLISEFVRDLRQRDTDNNTLVVLVTDHYSHRNTVYDYLQQQHRELVFWLFPPGTDTRAEKGREIAAPANTYDVGPTVLAAAGADVNRLGFGRNLFNPAPGEMATEGRINTLLDRLALHLWQPASLQQGLSIDTDGKTLHIGQQRYQLPTVLTVDNGLELESLFWDEKNTPLLNRFTIDNSLMIDSCAWWRAETNDELCVYYRSQSGRYGVEPIVNNRLSADHIYGVLRDNVQVEPWDKHSRVLVVARGGSDSFSGVFAGTGVQPFRRGVNVGRVTGAGVEMLAVFDTCQASPDRNDMQRWKALLDSGDRLLIAVADSGECASNSHNRFSRFYPSDLFANLGFREPYIALRDASGSLVWEGSDPQQHQVIYSLEVE